MSGAPSSSESASPTPAQADVSADAALILAALGRMEAVVRDERAAFTRLRVMLGDMAQAIARGKTVADSETATTLLDELEHRVDAMIEIAGPGPVAEAAAIPDPQPPSSAALVERDDAPLAHSSSEAQHVGAAPAPDAEAVEQAIRHAAEHDQVPTVSDVVSRLGADDEPPAAAAIALPPVDDSGIGAPTVAMLTAMVEALRDSISTAAPEPEAALESPISQAAEVVAQPLDLTPQDLAPQDLAPQDLAPQPETSSIEIAEVATPAAEIVHATEAAHLIEAPQAEAPQAVEATHTVEVAEAADIPPPADAVPDNSAFVAMLRARLDALNAAAAAAALEPEAPVAEVAAQPLDLAPQDLAPQDLAPQPETSSIEIAEVATPAAEIVHAAEAAHPIEAQPAEAPPAVEATHTVEVAEAADIPPPADPAPEQNLFVAMLNARLAELNASAAASVPEPEVPLEAPQPAPQTAEGVAQPLDMAPQPKTSSIEIAEAATPAAETVQAAAAAHITEAPQAGEATPASQAIHTADVAEAAPIPGPTVTDLHESALLASLEQMGARPFPPPDEGTAVIFAPKPELEFLPEFAREPAALAESQHAPLRAIGPEPAPAETTMAEIISDLTQSVAPAPAAHAVEVTAPDDVEPTTQIEPPAGPAAAAAPSDAVAAAETAESEFDPADFLFEPEPEPDPAAFLLDPAPSPVPRAKAPVLAQPDFVATPAKPAAEKPETPQPAEPDRPQQAAPEPAPRDPLHALKALSENEKLALFS
jgi:hypothetical protein